MRVAVSCFAVGRPPRVTYTGRADEWVEPRERLFEIAELALAFDDLDPIAAFERCDPG